MKAMVCDICGGKLVMKSGGIAVCDSCGMEYNQERMQEKVREIKGTVKIDNTDQAENWKKLAREAFDNSNYEEAYNYYCKVLEVNPADWEATYRKGMATGWQSNLANIRASEVIGGMVDARNKILADDSVANEEKAAFILHMSVEVINWIIAVLNLVLNHAKEYCREVMSACEDYYEQHQLLAQVHILGITNVDEFVYSEIKDESEAERWIKLALDMGDSLLDGLRTSFKVVDGGHYSEWTDSWKDDYTHVSPGAATIEAATQLEQCLQELKKQPESSWKEAREIKIMKDDIANFFDKHPEEKDVYERMLQNCRDEKQKYEASNSLKTEHEVHKTEKQDELKEQQQEVERINLENQKLSKKLFGKQKAQEKIDANNIKLQEVMNSIPKIEAEIAEIADLIDRQNANCQSTKQKYGQVLNVV